MMVFFHLKDSTLDVKDGSCNVIEVASYGFALYQVYELYKKRHRQFDNWFGRYYKVGWQNNDSEEGKYVYRRIGKVLSFYTQEYYHVGFSYSKLLGYWRVYINVNWMELKRFYVHDIFSNLVSIQFN